MSLWLDDVLANQSKDSEEEHKETIPILLMELGQTKCGVKFQHLTEVLETDEMTHYPEPHPLHLGIINLRGDIVPVICIRSILGVQEEGGTLDERTNNQNRIVVFRSDRGPFAIQTDRIHKKMVSQALLDRSDQVEIDGEVYKILNNSFFEKLKQAV